MTEANGPMLTPARIVEILDAHADVERRFAPGKGLASSDGWMGATRAGFAFPGGMEAFVRDFGRLQKLWVTIRDCWKGAADDAARLSCAREKLRASIAEIERAVKMRIPLKPELAFYRSFTEAEIHAAGALSDRLLTLPAYLPTPPDAADLLPADVRDPEARGWLTEGHGTLCGNRFANAAEELELVDALYAAGAERVSVPYENIQPDPVDGDSADALRVTLPADPTRRRAVLAIVNDEARAEGRSPDEDVGQESVVLWWD